MSYTELYQFDKKGDGGGLGEIHNSWRGAMAVWRIMEEKYLTPEPKPIWMDQKDYDESGYSRCMQPMMSGKHPMKPIWDLFDDDKISKIDKIVLGSTLDNVVVMKENLKELIEAFEEFEGDTSLKEQAELLKESLEDDDCIAVAWNQTSVNGDNWSNYNYDEETDKSSPYNILTEEKHWNLFDELNKKTTTND